MAEHLIKVADFSKTPGGRWKKDGSFSGEEFRDSILVPALESAREEGGQLIVNIDGVAGYASSFLEETFGGVVRLNKFAPEVLGSMLRIQSRDPVFAGFKADATRYFSDALKFARANAS